MSIICQNPAAFDGIISITLFLTELGLDALSVYFENPEFAVIASFIDSLASTYAKNAGYAGIQMMTGFNPELAFVGGMTSQFAQAGANTNPTGGAGDGPLVIASFMSAMYALRNTTPKTQYAVPESPTSLPVFGYDSYLYRLAGFTQIPNAAGEAPFAIQGVPIRVPIDAQSYENKYGWPVPTDNDIAAFLVSGIAPQFKNYSPAQQTSLNFPAQAFSDLFNAYSTWQIFCGSQSKGPPPPPHKQPPPPPPPPPPPDGGGDELTQCCEQTAYYLGLIAAALQNLTFPQETDSGCCDQVVNAIGGVAEQLKAITESLPGLKAAPSGSVDLSPIVDAFQELIAALTPVSVESPAINQTLQDRLTAISDAIANRPEEKPTDVTGIVDELKKANLLADVAPEILKQLMSDGLVDDAYSGFLQGSPWSWVLTIVHAVANSQLFQKWRQAEINSAKGDPLIGPAYKFTTTGKGANPTDLKWSDVRAFLLEALKAIFTTGTEASNSIFGPFIKVMLGVHQGEISKLTNVKPGDEQTAATKLLSEAVTFGVAAHFAACLGETLFATKSLGLPQLAALMAQLAGFEEIMKGVIEPEVMAAIGTPHRYAVNARVRSNQPMAMVGQILYSRRIITEGQLRQILAWDGLAREYEDAYVAGSFHQVNPRAIATAYQDVPFPRDQVQSMLEYGGARDADVHTLLDAFDFASIKNVRQQYLTSVIGAAERGNLTDADVDAALDSLQFSPTARNFVKLAIATRKLEQLDILYRKSVSEAYKFGLISDADYVPHMEAVGIAQADAEAHYAVDSIAKQGVQMRAAARAEARLESQIQRAAIQAAQLQFSKGQIDAFALAGELLAAGIDPRLAGLLTTIATLRKTARMVDVQGKLVTANEAILLKDRITAIKDQVTKKAIDPSTGETMLLGLGIPDENAKALLAAWVATAYKAAVPIQ